MKLDRVFAGVAAGVYRSCVSIFAEALQEVPRSAIWGALEPAAAVVSKASLKL